jgi:hypothetical protein
MGGVHVIPIYGAKGWEDRSIDYLSPPWMEMLRHAITEADRLDMGVDTTTGTGWCFGGPNVSDREANAIVVVKTRELRSGDKLDQTIDRDATQALVAFSDGGRCIDLTDTITDENHVKWTASEGVWQIYVVSQKPSGRMVKRAAPGGAGHMLNLLYPEGVQNYLTRFTRAFEACDGPVPRAMYHDSYEYRSDWSPDLFEQFYKRRGYRLQTELPALFGKGDEERIARVKCDYRETVSDVMVERSLPTWVDWSHRLGSLTRNQAHGSPGNLLDLYAAVDIPETEMFRTDRDPLVSKFASSAAHVAGRRLVAAETGTWLAEHFTETLADMKRLVDELLVSGVNHVVYHGTCYSPDEAGWPGWLFYASTQMNPRNSIWRDVDALNAYIARCQSILQSGQPDHDVLVYWPIHDWWHDAQGMVKPMTVHRTDWLHEQAIGGVARRLWHRGYTFDFVSDRQLADARVRQGRIELPGATYGVVVVPACHHMPVKTLALLLSLADAGAKVVFQDHLPSDVPGWGDLDRRRSTFTKLVNGLSADEADPQAAKPTQYENGKILVGDVEAGLDRAGVCRERMVDFGVSFIRRSAPGGRHYFVVNNSRERISTWVPIATEAESVAMMDPMTGGLGIASTVEAGTGNTSVYLQLEPDQSVFLRTFTDRRIAGPAWTYIEPAGEPVPIRGVWQVAFVDGGPKLPAGYETETLESWTAGEDPEAARFAGTARYSIRFDRKESGGLFVLDLGKVCQSARVCLNGRPLGTIFMPPFRVLVDELKPEGNSLEVEVTNVSANRIRDLDRRGVPWKVFHDINIVNVDYQPFDASEWPLYDSGLLGPVTLRPVRATPSESPTAARTSDDTTFLDRQTMLTFLQGVRPGDYPVPENHRPF